MPSKKKPNVKQSAARRDVSSLSKKPSQKTGTKKAIKKATPVNTIQPLIEDRQQLVDALASAEMGIWEWNLQSNIVLWSEKVFEIFGQRTKDLSYDDYYKQIHPEDRLYLDRLIEEAITKPKHFYALHRIIRPDGTVRWIESIGNTREDNEKKSTIISGTIQDVTSKVAIEQEKEEWKQRFGLIAESAGLVIYDYNISSGRIIWSGNTREVLGYTTEEMGHIDVWSDCIHPDDRDKAFTLLEKAQLNMTPYDVCYRFRTKSNGYCYMHDRGMFVPDANGEAIRMLGMMNDVSDKIAADEKIKASEASFRGLFDAVGEAIYIQNPDGTFLDVNNVACRMYGYAKKEFIGKTPEFISADGRNDYGKVEKFIQKALEGKPQVFEWWGKKKNDTVFLKEVHLVRGTYFGKEVIIASAWDITERRQAEESLRISEKRFRDLIRDLNVGVLIQGATSEILLSNSKALELLGLNRDQLFGKTSFDPTWNVIHDDGSDFPGSTHPVPQAIATGRPVRDVVMGVYRPKSKDRVWLLVNAEPIKTADQKLKEVICTFINITERKKIEQELKESEERFRTLQEASFGGIAIHDKGKIIDCNNGLSKITGYSHEELIGMDGLNLVAPEWRDFTKEKILAGYDKRYDVEGIRKDGSQYALEVQGKNIPYKDLGTIRVTEFRDITDRKLAKQKILEQNEKLLLFTEDLKRKNEQLEEFTQIVSHNLRSPVGNILSLLNFFENAESDEERDEYLHYLRESSTSTLNALDNLHEVLQVKQLKNIEKQDLEFQNIFDQAKAMLSGKITESNAVIKSDFTAAPTIKYPRIYLESILLNLLSNALKYSKENVAPVIEVKTYFRSKNLIIDFTDHGKGINLERYGHQVFKMGKTFHKNAESRSIGLFMIKSQIEALGGEISIESKENSGTTFTINFYKNSSDEQ